MSCSVDALMYLALMLVLVRVVLNCAEALDSKAEYATGRLFVSRAPHTLRSRPTGAAEPNLPRFGYLALIVLQMSGALILLATFMRFLTVPLLVWVLSAEVFLALRARRLGGDGSDQMHLILVCALVLYNATTDPLARSAVIWFIALQSMLAYLTSGAVKLLSRPWTRGTAISLVMSTETYGSRRLSQLLERMPWMSQLMCWGVIAFECGFFVAVLLGPKSAVLILACGAFFHLVVAATMGLNGFFWSFVATYPAVFAFSRDFQRLMHFLWLR